MPRAGLTASTVVASAGDLVDRDGLDALNLTAVAGQLGVRVPSLYKHVGGLADLQRRLALLGLCDLDRTLRDAAVGRAGRDALTAVCHAYRAYGQAHPGRYTAALRAPGTDDEELQTAANRVLDLMLAVLHGYGLHGEAAIHAVRTIRAALHGFVALEQAGGFGLPYDLDDTFAQLVTVLDGGLRSPTSPTARRTP